MSTGPKLYHHPSPFCLERGGALENLTIAYHTYGTLSPSADNVVWVCHALTASSDVADWWPHTIEKQRFLDPEKWFVVCANIIGSPYGTTSPLSADPATGTPYYSTFPKITIADMARAHTILARHLGISRVDTLIGSSVGGFQAVEWACHNPGFFRRMILIATDIHATPWTIAINETQRMAIMADPTLATPSPHAGSRGLAAARAIGLLTYRGASGYNRTQHNHPDTPAWNHRACTYQQYQGQKLCRRFNVYSYLTILDAFDTHDIARLNGGTQAALASLDMPTLVVGITTDLIFPPDDMKALAASLPNAVYREISSPFGHDGFLVEHEALNNIIQSFYISTSHNSLQ